MPEKPEKPSDALRTFRVVTGGGDVVEVVAQTVEVEIDVLWFTNGRGGREFAVHVFAPGNWQEFTEVAPEPEPEPSVV